MLFIPTELQNRYLHWGLSHLFFLDLLAKERVKEKRGGTVVDQPGRLLQGLQICPLWTNRDITIVT